MTDETSPALTFHFTCIAWGTEYVHMLTELVLPNFLGKGNIPDFAYRETSIFKIYSTEEFRETIEKSPAYQKLSAHIKTIVIDLHALTEQFKELPTFDTNEKYQLMNIGHQDAIRGAEDTQAYLVFLFPDHIYPKGTCEKLAQYAEEGKKVVMVGGIRTNREDVIPELQKFKQNDVLNVEAYELVDLTIEHMHEIGRSLYWGAPYSSSWPSHIYFAVGDEGLILRGFHLHPLMVLAKRKSDISLSIDVDYYHSVCDSMTEVHIADTSEELMCLELTSKMLEDRSRVPHQLSYQAIGRFIATQHVESIIYCASHPILFFRKSPTEIWETAIEYSHMVIEESLRSLIPKES